VKTVPTLRVVSTSDTAEQARQLDVELPAEVQVTLADIGAAAREGLLAMSVAAGMAVMQTLFDAEIAAVCGPKGRHDSDRTASRHGREKGSVATAHHSKCPSLPSAS
jgi:putative transposase